MLANRLEDVAQGSEAGAFDQATALHAVRVVGEAGGAPSLVRRGEEQRGAAIQPSRARSPGRLRCSPGGQAPEGGDGMNERAGSQ